MREVLLIFYTSASSFVHSQHWLIYDNQDNSIASFHTKYQISKYKKCLSNLRFMHSLEILIQIQLQSNMISVAYKKYWKKCTLTDNVSSCNGHFGIFHLDEQ